MKLNFLERLFINSPIRPFLQKHLEARQLWNMGGPMPGAKALEIGCGPGGGIDIIHDRFGASSVDAFDMDPKMVFLAKRRLHRKNGRCRLWVGNVRFIPVKQAQYDAVFNFGTIHHVENWRAALKEIFRVLRPGGKFYCEEILDRYITHPIIGKLMDHPQIDRFDQSEFIAGLRKTGFQVNNARQVADLYLWVVATRPKPSGHQPTPLTPERAET